MLESVLNKKNLRDYQQKVDNLSSDIDIIIDRLVRKYCSDLDSLMNKITERVMKYEENPLSDLELDYFILNLSQLIYWASEGQEILSVRADIAETLKDEGFLESFSNQTGTANQKKLKAEQSVLLETLTNLIYDKATKRIKLKVSYALEMLQSIKKIYTKRMGESNLDSYSEKVINTGGNMRTRKSF